MQHCTALDPTFIDVGSGEALRRVAVRSRNGGSPGVLWLGGFKSDMMGTKAAALDEWAAENNRAFVRFDYSGHGESSDASGDLFMKGTISRWCEESLAVFDHFCRGRQIIVGSSMGGWIALLLARERRRRRRRMSAARLGRRARQRELRRVGDVG